MTIDLNCDLGEGAENDDALLGIVTSANIACGVHAGDEKTMARAVESAKKHGVKIGAHPGFSDKENFGRRDVSATPEDVYWLTQTQILTLAKWTETIAHIKPHGALYHLCERDEASAAAFVRAVKDFGKDVKIYAFAGGRLARVASELGVTAIGEGFAERRYLPNGTLAPRSDSDALLTDLGDAARQSLALASVSNIGTLCVHGDAPDAVAIARAVRHALENGGFVLDAPR